MLTCEDFGKGTDMTSSDTPKIIYIRAADRRTLKFIKEKTGIPVKRTPMYYDIYLN